MKRATPKYVIVSPVRDEEQYIEKTLDSVIKQSVRPSEWIIVDDGSKDQTPRILERYAQRHSWLRPVRRRDRGSRVPGTGVVEAFYDGYDRLETKDWEYVVKLDGDVGLEPDYFERCFEQMSADDRLGICGGSMYCERNGKLQQETHPAFHVRGPIKLYRRECWEAIGGLIKAPGWDTVDEVEANRLGWMTRTLADLKVIHYRPTGAVQGAWRDGIKMGRAAYVSGYHPLFMAVKCLKRLAQKPYVTVSLAHAWGFASGYLKKLPQVDNPAFLKYIKTQQLRRLVFQDSIWK